MECGNKTYTRHYTLPAPFNINLSNQIEWVDIEINPRSVDSDSEEVIDENFLNLNVPVDSDSEEVIDENFLNLNVPDDLGNILRSVIGTRDIYTQEEFRAGERVYLCRRHRFAFHKDSWRALGCQCPDCRNDAHTRDYILPD
ncbi:MAG: hypothetical protein EBE86_008305 [Hormoscilla sp. GUM202]|nr:hypothetical protein [Hormoscilla sp. GUM202]